MLVIYKQSEEEYKIDNVGQVILDHGELVHLYGKRGADMGEINISKCEEFTIVDNDPENEDGEIKRGETMDIKKTRLDRKIEKKLGFNKIEENQYRVVYERKDIEFGYTHRVNLLHKKNGEHILQSYDPNLRDAKNLGNTCVGLTYQELKLFAKKMKQVGFN